MTQKDLNNWLMYHEIQKLARLDFGPTRIARYLGIDRRTVQKYLLMDEAEFETFLVNNQSRSKILSPFEDFVKNKLIQFEDTSAAQMLDWLKEYDANLPQVSPRTVFNFVMYVRQKYNIPVVKITREYFAVEELPYGEQAQVDFGEYNLRVSNGRRRKVRFFAMVLSRSRMKFIWFLDRPFTAETVCLAHEKAFAFFEGIPRALVYDQDRTLIVDENAGNLILTAVFREYVRSRGFKLHFCRKADPESKGKVENVIQYVKKNFLYNRLYTDLETLNTQGMAWLARTANYLPHNVTKKPPEDEFRMEKQYLNTYLPMAIENKEMKTYLVRKNNTVAYKSNFYSVPVGTRQGSETYVNIKENGEMVEIYSLTKELICSHKRCFEQGKTIVNTHHKRDTAKSLDEMIRQTACCFTRQEEAEKYLRQIQAELPRYTRDHLQVILKALSGKQTEVADLALRYCIKHQLFDGHEFEQVYQLHFLELKPAVETPEPVKLLDNNSLGKANETPQKSNMDDYENIINS